ncbi:sialidase family protein, partial [Roseisolibacter sp. H3M3-2]|uniref:sialidase family protein n=1 Tax=Roseisolibacter sp. H3M3-2 TaxID=3031323 RepID=UPI0023DA70FC
GPGGRRAVAWVSAPGGGSDGRLYVALADSAGTLGAPVEVRDPLGGIEPHGEAPPKLAYGADGALYALWVVGKEVPGRRFPASALRFARSADGGRTWGAPASVTDTPQPWGSFNFHSLQAGRGDTVYAAWLDGRGGKSATYFTRSADGGRTWAPNVRVSAGESCPCCRTAVAPGRGDTVYAAWRTVAAGQVREVVVARSADGGRTWDAPARAQRDGWVIDGCPHAGPSLAVDSTGRVHVAWWSGREGAAGTFYARSDDGGRTFDAPVALGVAERSRPAHVQLAAAGGRVVVAWDDGTRNTPVVRVRVSRDGGATFGAAASASDGARAATFPVLALDGARLSLAWSEEAADDAHAQHRPDMKDPKARMPLPTVGRRTVVVRDGAVD